MTEENDNQTNEQVNTSGEKLAVGPLSKEDSERLQCEANEETTNSEDLRLFLQVMYAQVANLDVIVLKLIDVKT
ncbi:hypothetical protein ACTXT7_011510, partial [Hymenolepis weldensis]